MDLVLGSILLLLLVFAVWRFRNTYRRAKRSREEEIRSRLSELRKKRDEQ